MFDFLLFVPDAEEICQFYFIFAPGIRSVDLSWKFLPPAIPIKKGIMKQQLIQNQTQRLTPQQVQVIRLLELPTDELEQRINEELENNFVLEEGPPESAEVEENAETPSPEEDDGFPEKSRTEENPGDASDMEQGGEELFFDYDDEEDTPAPSPNADDDLFSPLTNCQEDTSFREDLNHQLALFDLPDEERFLAQYIIESLDDAGYLPRPLSALVDDLAFTQNHETTLEALEAALDIVQGLEPAGIGARDLRECLLLQLEEKAGTEIARLAYRMLDKAFDDFSNKRYERLMQKFSASSAQMEAVRKLILTLHPKPAGVAAGLDEGKMKIAQATPDFVIDNEDGELVLNLNDARVPPVRINHEYDRMLDDLKNKRKASPENREGIAMIRRKMNEAHAFMDALRQRRQTLLAVMRTIVQMQREFFLTGDVTALKPMVLQDVADRCGYDVSTISRVSNGKFVQTDFGILPVKRLFSEALQTESGDVVSNTAVLRFLENCIQEEDKRNPLTDERLAEALKAAGYPVARRTVAKYREQLGYNTARLRREL